MTLRLRLRVWWRRYALTEALADGADPDASDELTLVARELIGMRTRQRLATALDRLVRAAFEPTVPWSPALPLNKREMRTTSSRSWPSACGRRDRSRSTPWRAS